MGLIGMFISVDGQLSFESLTANSGLVKLCVETRATFATILT